MKRDDVIVSVDGHNLVTPRELTCYVANKAPGTRVTLELVREGSLIKKQVTLGARPEMQPARTKDRSQKRKGSGD